MKSKERLQALVSISFNMGTYQDALIQWEHCRNSHGFMRIKIKVRKIMSVFLWRKWISLKYTFQEVVNEI